ncbi:hypothetical protein M3Y94_01165600 [Aphelenchoides besseyi]|nr:hypothetical protein M3Y94_01165600 [Aphelenchoides besseyi]
MPRGRPKRSVYSPPVVTPRARGTRSGRPSSIRKETTPSTKQPKAVGRRRGRQSKKPQKINKSVEYENDSSDDFGDDKENSVSSLDEITSNHYDDGKDLDDDPDFDFIEDSAASSSGTSAVEREIFCPWIELSRDQIPPLVLPESSVDLLIESELLIPAVEVRCRIPFNFCSALRAPDQTRLLAEIHIAFIRLLFRDDEDNQTTYSVQDTNHFFNLMFQLLDGMTYAEVLRYYVESDKWNGSEEVAAIIRKNYPFVDGGKRIVVLRWLCDRFMETTAFRQLIKNEGKLTYDDICRDCGKPGEVLLCDGCEACYHLECTSLKSLPAGSWFCQVCELHAERGAVSLRQLSEVAARHRMRISPLGHDRHGREFWFFAKRLFMQVNSKSGAVYYYSSLPQFYEIIRSLDPFYYEKSLCERLFASLDEISSCMRSTLELTHKHRLALIQKIANRETPTSYLDSDNSFRMSDILNEILIEREKHSSKDLTSITKRTRELLGFENGRLVSTFWSGDLNEDQLLQMQQCMNAESMDGESTGTRMKNDNMQRGYRLSFSDGKYRDYINEYAINDFAKPAYQRTKERDRRKYLSLRFALTDEGEFSWFCPKARDIYCSETNANKVFQLTLKKLMDKIPDELLHRLWNKNKQSIVEQLQQANHVDKLRHLLLLFERVIRKPVFGSIWWNSLGLTKLTRITTDVREDRAKLETKRKKEERALQIADPTDTSSDVVFVKYIKTRPTSFSLWRMKDEGYRLNNRGQMGGWIWMSSTFVRSFEIPSKPNIKDINYEMNITESTPTVVKKLLRLEHLGQRLARWREMEEQNENLSTLNCYSANCRANPLSYSYQSTGPTSRCYNSSCPRRYFASDTTNASKAYKDGIKTQPRPVNSMPNVCRMSVLGEGKPFPFPKPFDYLARHAKKSSLLVLPQATLRRMARQGGLNVKLVVPGFNRQAKSNQVVWNYPCSRPIFDNCWRYVTLNSTTLHALALNLRRMYACIRWSDFEPPEDLEDIRVISHLPDRDERRSIVSHKEHPPDGYYEQYKLAIQILSIDDEGGADDDFSESYHTGGSTHRSRKRKATRKSGYNGPRKVTGTKEKWADGVDLKLYEIRNYWARFNRQMSVRRTNEQHPSPVVTTVQHAPNSAEPPPPKQPRFAMRTSQLYVQPSSSTATYRYVSRDSPYHSRINGRPFNARSTNNPVFVRLETRGPITNGYAQQAPPRRYF